MKQDWVDLPPLLVDHNLIKCKVTDDVESYEYVKASWECFQTMTRDTVNVRTTPVRQPGTPLTWYICLGDPHVWKIFCLLFRGMHNCVLNFRVHAQPLICQLVCFGLSRNFFHQNRHDSSSPDCSFSFPPLSPISNRILQFTIFFLCRLLLNVHTFFWPLLISVQSRFRQRSLPLLANY
jgi:hypothetical protein